MSRRVVVLASAIVALTWFVGWWGVLLVSVGWSLAAESHTKPARTAALGAIVAWSVLLLWTAMRGPVWRLSDMLAGMFGLPAVALLVATVAFPGLVALSAAALVGEAKKLQAGDGRSTIDDALWSTTLADLQTMTLAESPVPARPQSRAT